MSKPIYSNKGMTLVELLIAMAISAILLSGLGLIMANVSSISTKTSSNINIQSDAQITLNRLSDAFMQSMTMTTDGSIAASSAAVMREIVLYDYTPNPTIVTNTAIYINKIKNVSKPMDMDKRIIAITYYDNNEYENAQNVMNYRDDIKTEYFMYNHEDKTIYILDDLADRTLTPNKALGVNITSFTLNLKEVVSAEKLGIKLIYFNERTNKKETYENTVNFRNTEYIFKEAIPKNQRPVITIDSSQAGISILGSSDAPTIGAIKLGVTAYDYEEKAYTEYINATANTAPPQQIAYTMTSLEDANGITYTIEYTAKDLGGLEARPVYKRFKYSKPVVANKTEFTIFAGSSPVLFEDMVVAYGTYTIPINGENVTLPIVWANYASMMSWDPECEPGKSGSKWSRVENFDKTKTYKSTNTISNLYVFWPAEANQLPSNIIYRCKATSTNKSPTEDPTAWKQIYPATKN